MKPHHTLLRLVAVAGCGLWLLGNTTKLAAQPALAIARDPSGLKITWPVSPGPDFVLEASNDMVAWTNVNQSVVLEGAVYRVFVPASQAMKYHRLVKDGVQFRPAYVGSQTCATCHGATYNTFIKSGHPWKITKVNNGVPPTLPFTTTTNVPAGYTWNDVTYQIGGYAWKTRWTDTNGFVITGNNVQWNLGTSHGGLSVPSGWGAYNPQNPVGTQVFDCGRCHTTGWVPISQGGVPQDGLKGIIGSFALPGVQCEACHGPGGRHVTNPKSAFNPGGVGMAIDRSAASCGACHIRGAANTIPASGGFVRHHEQFNELLSNKHSSLTNGCVTCHNPHISTQHGQVGAITKSCTECHSAATYTPKDNHATDATCTDCHMPKAMKTAVHVNKYIGDLQSHIFKINTSTNSMFNAAGTFANETGAGVGLAFACYGCHNDLSGIGGGRAPALSLEDLSGTAVNFHRTR